MGHIELAVPVSHIWYFKSRKINKLLDITNLNLERVLYYESYIVITSEHPSLKPGKVLDDEDYYAARETYGDDAFTVGMGAEAISRLLEEIDLDELAATLRTSIANETTQSRRQKNLKRLKEVVAFENSKNDNKPEWMILRSFPFFPRTSDPLCHWRAQVRLKRPERSLPKGHKPEQQASSPPRPPGTGRYPQEREKNAPGGR